MFSHDRRNLQGAVAQAEAHGNESDDSSTESSGQSGASSQDWASNTLSSTESIVSGYHCIFLDLGFEFAG